MSSSERDNRNNTSNGYTTSPCADEKNIQETTQRLQRSIINTISSWIWELASIGAASGVLCAIFVTLAIDSGREVPNWPLSLNLSSLIAIYTTVLRALLFFALSEIISQEKWAWINRSHRLRHFDTFDHASRGAWGCVRLIQTCFSSG